MSPERDVSESKVATPTFVISKTMRDAEKQSTITLDTGETMAIETTLRRPRLGTYMARNPKKLLEFQKAKGNYVYDRNASNREYQ